jgi:hypothetical protein
VSWGRLRRSGRERAATPEVESALADLARLAAARPELAEPGEMLSRIIRAAFSAPGSPEPALRAGQVETEFLIERIREGWSEGEPAVRVVAPALDQGRLVERAEAIVRCAREGFAPSAALGDLIARQPEHVARLATGLLMKGDVALEQSMGKLGLEPTYPSSVLRLVLLGELGEWSARICTHLGETSWPRGDCPVCGARPALGESRGLEQRRFLRCDRCGADWPGYRLRCPFCALGDHQSLRFVHVEGEQERFRLALCEGCGGRLKSMATLSPLTPPGLLVAQLAMVHLDLIDPDEAAW